MKVLANTLRPGHAIEHENKKYVIVKYELILPGKGNAFIAVDMRDAITGVKTNERFRTQETVDKLMTSEKSWTMLYTEGDQINLMDTATYDQFNVPIDMAGEARVILTEGMDVTVDTVDDMPVGVRLPPHITLEIVEADAVVKGQTASSSYKLSLIHI